MCKRTESHYHNKRLRELTERIGESAGTRLPSEIDTHARNNLFSFIQDEYNSAQKKAERVRDIKLRLLASSEDISPHLVSALLGVN